ncbi:D-sedoheptulose-7-phosphate isomerase [Anaerovibrio lipolyticus]|nr:SIS domain-containing protein [Anaerovibrio lipolyticus]
MAVMKVGKVMDFKQDISDYVALEIETLKKLDVNAVNEALNLLLDTAKKHKRVYVFGNGGSSATASHIVNDFGKGVSEYVEDKFRFQCLNDNVPTVMAIANDIGFDEIFRFQLRGVIEPGDVVIAISGSGNSKNVINAVEYAKSHGNKIIGLTGFDGGKLRKLSDISLHVPINSMQITEDIHMIYDHLMMSMFYCHLCGKNHLVK